MLVFHGSWFLLSIYLIHHLYVPGGDNTRWERWITALVSDSFWGAHLRNSVGFFSGFAIFQLVLIILGFSSFLLGNTKKNSFYKPANTSTALANSLPLSHFPIGYSELLWLIRNPVALVQCLVVPMIVIVTGWALPFALEQESNRNE